LADRTPERRRPLKTPEPRRHRPRGAREMAATIARSTRRALSWRNPHSTRVIRWAVAPSTDPAAAAWAAAHR
jgi:hypothetical protein